MDKEIEFFLKKYHYEELQKIISCINDSPTSINVNLSCLKEENCNLFYKVLNKPHKACTKWKKVLLNMQKSLLDDLALEPQIIKQHCSVRFINLNESVSIFPNIKHVGKLFEIKGSVTRISEVLIKEIIREYICNQCKQCVVIQAEYCRMYTFEQTYICKSPGCRSFLSPKHTTPKQEYCIDYQEINIQEILADQNKTSSLIVTLETDLVDSCNLGNFVTICGTIERRWKILRKSIRSIIILSMKAISVALENQKSVIQFDMTENFLYTSAEHHFNKNLEELGEYHVRDIILKSICPTIFGMDLVKLAIALSICSTVDNNELITRSNSHLLLVGDPGLAKTKLLKCASEISLRSVHTNGMGISSAGLTASAVKEDGEWHLEAGALVLADGGICCIDEFNLVKECDKVSLHEAMEQQRISFAKAGLVCQLKTQCVILAASNPKITYSNNVNIGIKTPLLSRFDVIFILRDYEDEEWDVKVSDHIINQILQNENNSLWNMKDLQLHFMAASQINPEMTPQAKLVLGAYYKMCRTDPLRDASRTSIRLWDSLVRLAQSHARLLLRSRVLISDAIIVIRLLESSYEFGRILKPLNIIQDLIPIPNPVDDQNILKILKLDKLKIEDDGNIFTKHKIKEIHSEEIKTNRTPQNISKINKTRTEPTSSTFQISDHNEDLSQFLNFLDSEEDNLNNTNSKITPSIQTQTLSSIKRNIPNMIKSNDKLKPGDVELKFQFKRKRKISKSEHDTEINRECSLSRMNEEMEIKSYENILEQETHEKIQDELDFDRIFLESDFGENEMIPKAIQKSEESSFLEKNTEEEDENLDDILDFDMFN